MLRKRKGQRLAGWLLICILMIAVPLPVQAKNAKNTWAITFHYNREDQQYTNWSVWLWNGSEEGRDYIFESTDDFGACTTIQVSDVDQNSKVGFLIKYGNWEKKDMEQDRYLDLSKEKGGKLDVYVYSGEEKIQYEKPEEKRLKILSAKWDSMNLVTVKLRASKDATIDPEEIVLQKEDHSKVKAEVIDWKVSGQQIHAQFQTDLPMQMYTAYQCSTKDADPVYIDCGKVFDTEAFNRECVYKKEDLGITFQNDQSVQFCVWAPTAQKLSVLLYENGDGGNAQTEVPMIAGEHGEWKAVVSRAEAENKYYTYRVQVMGKTSEVIDPYAKACGVNGMRGMVLDLEKTDPAGFSEDKAPALESRSDDSIYEISVRDFTISNTSGVKNAGKYLGLTEQGTTNKNGDSTGLDYLKELGVSYVQIMPTQDFYGIDEETQQGYNWGYNPMNFNIPEGSYATDASKGEVRVNEYKQMVQALHKAGIRVILDVVYNHTYQGIDSSLNTLVPSYYYRWNEDGTLSNGSGCGNEIATERAMAQKLIIDSTSYWVNEYHVDGFRFDLMGLFDLKTTKKMEKTLHEMNPDLLLYGEGWNAGDSVYKKATAVSGNAKKLKGIGFFNNAYRRGIQAYISNDLGEKKENINWVYFGTEGAADLTQTKQSLGAWTASPRQSIQYTSCHDGYTLYDLLCINNPKDDKETLLTRNKMAVTLVMTGAGIPFFQSGEEFLRTKTNADGTANANSYDAGDAVNAIDWELRSSNQDMVAYYKKLIQFRKQYPQLAAADTKTLNQVLQLDLKQKEKGIVSYKNTKNHYNLWNTTIKVTSQPKSPVSFQLRVRTYPGIIPILAGLAVVVVLGGIYRRKRK